MYLTPRRVLNSNLKPSYWCKIKQEFNKTDFFLYMQLILLLSSLVVSCNKIKCSNCRRDCAFSIFTVFHGVFSGSIKHLYTHAHTHLWICIYMKTHTQSNIEVEDYSQED